MGIIISPRPSTIMVPEKLFPASHGTEQEMPSCKFPETKTPLLSFELY